MNGHILHNTYQISKIETKSSRLQYELKNEMVSVWWGKDVWWAKTFSLLLCCTFSCCITWSILNQKVTIMLYRKSHLKLGVTCNTVLHLSLGYVKIYKPKTQNMEESSACIQQGLRQHFHGSLRISPPLSFYCKINHFHLTVDSLTYACFVSSVERNK